MKNTFIVVSENLCPYDNQALELVLLRTLPQDSAALYLWRNRRTVVVGRNQQLFDECRVGALLSQGGTPARRLSGGGAVYHDENNLNYSFVLPAEACDVPRQLGVVLRAVKSLGIDAQMSGRNDLEAGGGKFSGNAFYKSALNCLHHGTLLIDTELSELESYLTPNEQKLKSRSVRSVRSRVVNLSQLAQVNYESISQALRTEFTREYSGTAGCGSFEPDLEQLDRARAFFANERWVYGDTLRCTQKLQHRFSWGGLSAQFYESNGVVLRCALYSDSLEYEVFGVMARALAGTEFAAEKLGCVLFKLAQSTQLNEIQKEIVIDTANLFIEETSVYEL